MIKLKILKAVGPYMPGQEVEVDDETAKHLADGVKAMKVEDFEKAQAAKKDIKGLTVKQMNDLGAKNVVGEDMAVYMKTEKAAISGKPVASGETITVTGGITPPTMVFPDMARVGGHETTDVSEVKSAKKVAKEDKPAEAKK